MMERIGRLLPAIALTAAAALERLLSWTEPARDALGLDVALGALNGAQRAIRAREQGESIESIYREVVAETRRTYVPEGVVG